ncbi:MAG: hypothetical protein OXJ62_09690, partial [Spirochaetaceae bacterium]|nr:hypothetical protein [Spirochaetaceae bacterium]
FVEGKPDRALVECLLKYLCIDHVEVEIIGGGVSKLGHVANQIKRRHDRGSGIAMILDADDDLQKARAEYDDAIRTHILRVDRVFFLPDNKRSGCLENLLQQISLPEHDIVYDCFRNMNSAYTTGIRLTAFPV